MKLLLQGAAGLSLVGALITGAVFPAGGLILGALGLFLLDVTTRL